ncbi:MAG: hypothetical protein FWC32_05010, partial [Firmicutes bacterium]|nr:hypothetical protein [Bacillota bacterium]
MNPRLGRWTQPDPFFHMRFGQARMMGSPNAIAQAGNLFVFTMNNPVMWRDPTGLFAQCALCCCGFIPIPWSPRATSPWDTSRKNPNSPVNQGNASNSSNAVTTPPGAAPPRIPLIINASNSFIGGAILNIYDIGGGGGGGSGGSGGSGSSSSLPHQPWDRFATMDAAAIAFAVTRTGHADILNREIGAIIYSVTVGPRWNNTQFYTFGRPWVGQQYNVVAGFITRLLVPEIPSPWHANARMVALAHTHPFGSTLFSQEDMNITTGRYNIFGVGVPAMPVYMAVNTPAGLEVRVFTSDMCQTTQLGGRLIYSR